MAVKLHDVGEGRVRISGAEVRVEYITDGEEERLFLTVSDPASSEGTDFFMPLIGDLDEFTWTGDLWNAVRGMLAPVGSDKSEAER